MIYIWASWRLLSFATEGWTHACGKRRGWPVCRGERLIKLGDSWFSAKSIDVKPSNGFFWGRALNGCGGCLTLPSARKLRIQKNIFEESVPGCEGPGTRGKQPRSFAKVLKLWLREKGDSNTVTAKRWAWKQPSLRESVIAQ